MHTTLGTALVAAESAGLRTAVAAAVSLLLPLLGRTRTLPGPSFHTSLVNYRPGSSASSLSQPTSAVPELQNDDAVSPAVQVPLVPGTYFRLKAVRAAVRVQHVACWSDVATLRGRPHGGSLWTAVPVDVPIDSAEATSSSAVVRQVYEIQRATADGRPELNGGSSSSSVAGDGIVCRGGSSSLNYSSSSYDNGGGGGSAGGGGGLLHLSIPEKWISLDIETSGYPVSVSKIVEADLRVVTGGASVTLGSVRALRVELDTLEAVDSGSIGASTSTSTSNQGCIKENGSGGGDGRAVAGSVTGGEVSGTSIAILAAGFVHVRRLMGSDIRLAANVVRQAAASSAASPATCRVMDTAKAEIELGAVYGGRLQIRTGGGAVRIGTLDCGAGHGGGCSGATSASAATSTDANTAESSGGDGSGDWDNAAHCGSSGSGAGGGGSGGGGADILSYGGAVILDGLEGDAVVDSSGGTIKVLVQPGLRSARLVSEGGSVEVAVAPGTALEHVEVRRAVEVRVQPELQRHLELLPSSSPAAETAAAAAAAMATVSSVVPEGAAPTIANFNGNSSSSLPSVVWAAKVVSEPESGRTAGRGAEWERGPGGVLVVDAGGGTVSLRRVGWMEALSAKMSERMAQNQKH